MGMWRQAALPLINEKFRDATLSLSSGVDDVHDHVDVAIQTAAILSEFLPVLQDVNTLRAMLRKNCHQLRKFQNSWWC